MRFSVEPREGYLLATLRARESAGEMREFLTAVQAACRQHACPKVLVSVRASHAVFRPEDYGLSGATKGYAAELASPACQVALVGDTPELNLVAVRVTVQQDLPDNLNPVVYSVVRWMPDPLAATAAATSGAPSGAGGTP